MTRIIPLEYLERVLAFIESNESITNRQCRELLGVNYDESIKLFKALCLLGLIRQSGSGSMTKYIKGDRSQMGENLDSPRGGYRRNGP